MSKEFAPPRQRALCFNEPGCSASGVTKLVVNGSAAGTLLQGVSTLASANHAGNTVSFPQPFTTAHCAAQNEGMH